MKKEGPGPGRRPNSVPAARPEAVPTLGPTGGSSLPDGSLHLHDRKSHALADNSKEASSRLVWLSEETRLPPPTPRATCPHPPPGEDTRPQGRLGCHPFTTLPPNPLTEVTAPRRIKRCLSVCPLGEPANPLTQLRLLGATCAAAAQATVISSPRSNPHDPAGWRP